MSYKQDMKAFREDMMRRRRALILAIKITVVVVAALFLLTAVMLIIDLASGNAGTSHRDGSADKTAPVITLKEGDVIYLYAGENVAWRSYVELSDSSGTAKIDSVDTKDVRLDEVGIYSVTYKASDSSGNVSTLKVKVVITKKEFSYDTLMGLIAKKAEELGINSSMTKQQQVFAVYEFVNSPSKSAANANIVFVDESNIPAIKRANWETDWVEEASRALASGEGDCYSYYSVSKAFFEYLGIENMGIRRNDSASDYTGTHFWSIVNIGTSENPRWYFYDATRLSGKFSDNTTNGCLRTYAELFEYKPSDARYDANDFYVFDSNGYPSISTVKIAR